MPVFYPDCLTHVCRVRRFSSRYDDLAHDLDDSALSLGNALTRVPVDPRSYEKVRLVQTVIHRVVRLIGLTPSTVTVTHMDSTDYFFKCGVCLAASSTETLRQLYSWRHMVLHCPEVHFFNRKAAKAGITAMHIPTEIPDGHQALMDHLREVHENNQPVEAVDYQRKLGMQSQPRVLKVSLKKQAAVIVADHPLE
ncbi:hypothetical protein BDZ89DRAFT_1037080 [Hymenopellis radicata]|nr:hypothetical protein BDZ89DRAFT_1037080 [Hymenopellis radicata]